jgi:hypothetical protein
MYRSVISTTIINENNVLKSKYAVLYEQYTQLHTMYLTLYKERVAKMDKKRDHIQSIVIPPEEIISALQEKIRELTEIIISNFCK